MTELEQLLVRIDATTEQLRRELKRADDAVAGTERNINRTTANIERAFSKMGRNIVKDLAGPLAVAFSVQQIGRFVTSSVKAADALNDMSKKTGVAVEAMQRLKYVSHQSGVEISGLASGFGKFQVKLSEADSGVKSAQKSFASLGLNFQELRKLAPEEQIARLADRIDALKDPADKARAATELFGKAGRDLVPAFEGGSAAMRKLFQEQGKVLSKEEMDKIDEAGDKWSALQSRLELVAARGFVSVYDAMKMVREEMQDFFGVVDNSRSSSLHLAASKIKDQVLNIDKMIAAMRKTDAQWGADSEARLDRLIANKERLLANYKELQAAQAEIIKSKLPAVQLPYADKLGKAPDEAAEKAAEKQADYNEELRRTVYQMEELNEANQESKNTYEALKREIDAENEAREQGYKIGTKEFQQIKELIIQRERLKKTIDETDKLREQELKKQAEAHKRLEKAMIEPWTHAFENVQDALADMLVEGKYSFETLANIAKRLAAEVAAAWIIKPALEGTLGAVIGTSGASPSSGAGSSSLVSDGIQTLLTKGIGATGVGQALNGWAATALPSVFADTGAAIAAAGSAVGPVTAAQAGAAAALPFASIALPVAAIVLPMILSKVFGGGRAHPASNFGAGGFDAGGNLSGVALSSKHTSTEYAAGLSQSLSAITQQIVAASGLNFSGINSIQGGSDDGRGFLSLGDFKKWDSNTLTFKPNDKASAESALGAFEIMMIKRLDSINNSVSDTAMAALDKIKTEGRAAQEIVDDINFALTFEKMGQPAEVISEAEAALNALNESFKKASETAERLGLSTQKVADAQAKALATLRGGFDQTVTESILSIINQPALAMAQELARFEKQMADAQKLGADTRQVELLHKINMAKIQSEINATANGELETMQQRLSAANELVGKFKSLASSYAEFLNAATTGEFSGLSPMARLEALRGQRDTLAQQARLGDADAAQKLIELMPELLQLSAEVNGYNSVYAQDLADSKQIASQTKAVIDRQVTLQQQIADASTAQIQVLQSGFDRMVAAIMAGTDTSAATNAAGTNLSKKVPIAGTGGSLTVGEIENIGRSLLGGYTGKSGNGEINRLLAERGLTKTFNDLLRIAAGGVKGYATGGFVTGGTVGVDTVPAMLSNREFVIREQAATRIGASALHHMNSTGALPATPALDSKLDAVISGLRSINLTLAATGNATVPLLKSASDNLSAISSNAKLASAR